MTGKARGSTYTTVRLAEAISLLKHVAVNRKTEADLRGSDPLRDVVFDGLIGRFAGARATVEVSLVVGDCSPGTGVVICLEDIGSY